MTGHKGENGIKTILKSKIVINLLIIAVFFVTFSLISEHYFNLQNFINIGLQSAIVTVLAFGVTMIIIAGGIDLSVGSTVALGMCFAAIVMKKGVPVPAAIVLSIAVAAFVGFLNGFIVAKTGIHPFLVTLGMMNISRGTAYLLTSGATVSLVSSSFKKIFAGYIGRFPVSVIYMLVVLVAVAILLSNTKIGREMYAVGSNPTAARLSGIKNHHVTIFVFTAAGICYGLAACLACARVGAGTATYGVGLETQAIAGAILGGTSFTGGSGNAFGTLTGSILLVVLINGLTICGVSTYAQMVVEGFVIILAVYIDTLSQKNKR